MLLELYETACKHFNELLRQDLTVTNDLERFRRSNAVYSIARNLYEIPHNLAARTGLIKKPLGSRARSWLFRTIASGCHDFTYTTREVPGREQVFALREALA
jgi:hypothetical protein